ncbi:MAG: hypothetical protein ACKOEM_07895 [Planctomycetia bacterium]
MSQSLRPHPQERQKLSKVYEAFRLEALVSAQSLARVLLVEKVLEPLLNGRRQPALLQIAGQVDVDRQCHIYLRSIHGR